MVLGNLPRFISSAESGNTLPVTEPVLYTLTVFILLVWGESRRFVWHRYRWIFICLTASYFYGIALNGFDIKALVFNVRFQLQLLSALLIGRALYRQYGVTIMRMLRVSLNMYLWVAGVSLTILLVWPISSDFYSFLESIGVQYVGDPHVWRLISPYLDPNLFGTIAVLPMYFALALAIFGRRPIFLWVAIGFAALIALTVSRSGAGSVILFLAVSTVICLRQRFVERRDKLVRLIWLQSSIFASIAAGAVLIVLFALPPLIARLNVSIEDEGSALLRYQSFILGMDAIEERPIFGVGFNYGYEAGLARTLPSENVGTQVGLDSSLQLTAINFGVLPSALMLWAGILWAIRTRRQLARLHRNLFAYFLAYIVVVTLFSSLFNNLLYYQFWLLPVVALGTYFAQLSALPQVNAETDAIEIR